MFFVNLNVALQDRFTAQTENAQVTKRFFTRMSLTKLTKETYADRTDGNLLLQQPFR